MRILSIFSLLLALAIPASAESPLHKWSTVFPGNHGAYCWAIAIDGTGNAFLAMTFGDSICVGTDTLVAVAGPPEEGSNDILLTKVADDGQWLWSRQFGNGNRETIDKVDCDAAGNVVIAGRFRGTIDFGGGPLTSPGTGDDVYVACFDAGGNHRWSRRFGNVGGEWASGVAFDGDGNVVFCGQANGTVDVGGGPMTGAPYLIFVVKLDGTGNHVWSHGYPVNNGASFHDVTCDDDGNIVAVGRLAGPVDFGGGALIAPGYINIFLMKLDEDGTYVFAKQFGDEQEQTAYDVVCDAAGNIFMVGEFDGTVNFGGGDVTSMDDGDPFTDDSDACLVKFSGSGAFVWQRTFVGPLRQGILDVALDGIGNVIVSGDANNQIDFGYGAVPCHGQFVAAVDAAGTNLWQIIDGINVADVAAGADGTIWICGFYTGYQHVGSEVLPWTRYAGIVATFANPQATTVLDVTPAVSRVSGNFPNPFNPATTISFTLGSQQHAVLGVYDAAGRRVRMIDRGELGVGTYSARWDGRDDSGRAVASGVYFCRLESVPGAGSRKMLLLK